MKFKIKKFKSLEEEACSNTRKINLKKSSSNMALPQNSNYFQVIDVTDHPRFVGHSLLNHLRCIISNFEQIGFQREMTLWENREWASCCDRKAQQRHSLKYKDGSDDQSRSPHA